VAFQGSSETLVDKRLKIETTRHWKVPRLVEDEQGLREHVIE
jgi:hypothetical protein